MNRVRWYWYRLVQRGKVLLIFSQMLLLALAEKYDEQAEQQTDDYDAHLAIINDRSSETVWHYAEYRHQWWWREEIN